MSGHVGVEKLPFVKLRDRYQATIDAVALVQNEEGGTVATLPTERSEVDLSEAEYRHFLARGLPYQRAITLPPGRYQVRLAVREDSVGLLGSAWQKVEVPDTRAGPPDAQQPLPAEGERREPGARIPGPLPTCRAPRRCDASAAAKACTRRCTPTTPSATTTGEADLVSQAEILRGGVTLGTAAPEPIELGEPEDPPVPHTARIRLQRFEPGDYELRLTVTDRNASTVVSRSVAFTID